MKLNIQCIRYSMIPLGISCLNRPMRMNAACNLAPEIDSMIPIKISRSSNIHNIELNIPMSIACVVIARQ